MKKCKYCQAELAENGTFCPVCGKDNTEAETVEQTPSVEESAVAEEAVPAQQAAPVAEAAIPSAEEAVAAAAPSAQIKEGVKASPAKIAIAVAAVVVLVAVLVALVATGLNSDKAKGGTVASEPSETVESTVAATEATIPADGNPDDETCKGTYTASDEEVIANGDTIVATIGDFQLTNAELQVYYWLEVQSFLNNYGSYVYYFGLDYTQPLDTQSCYLMESGTWQQFFLASALQSWQNYQSMYAEAEANGFELSAEDQEYLANLGQTLEENAAAYGFEDAKAMLAYNVGNGAELEDYIQFNNVYYKGYQYYTQLCDAIDLTDEALEEYYLANEETYTSSGITREDKYVDVRHILVMVEGGTTDEEGNTTYSDAEWETCRAEAQAILDAWLAGEATEDSFAALANEKSDDGGSNTNGGLYTDVYEGQMVTNFNDWCFDESRVYGDYGLVQTNYGYHVMYFVGSTPVWKSYAENDLLSEKISAMIEEIVAKYPMTVDYSSILLGYVDMNA